MRGFFEDMGLPILCMAGIFLAVNGAAILYSSYQCGQYEAVTGRPTRYAALTCYVHDKGDWYAWDEYKHRLATKGAFRE